MSKILDLQKRANNLLSQHQNDIDEAEQRNQSDIQRYAEYSAKRSTELEQQYRQHQNGYTAETERSNERDIAADRPDYSSNQKQQQQGMTALLQEQQQQIKQLQANLQQLNGLSKKQPKQPN